MTTLPIGPVLTSSTTMDERDLIDRMVQRLQYFEAANALKLAYYEGKQRVRQLGISVPPNLSRIEIAAGWAGTVVDVLEERLDWHGWRGEGSAYDLPSVHSANALDLDASKAHLDALIYGTSFAVVGSGDVGEPNPLVTVHSPRAMTGLWNTRKRRLEHALSVVVAEGQVVGATLYSPDETATYERSSGGPWRVVDRDRHRLGRCLAVQLENRPRNDTHGRSEISEAVRAHTDQAVRTLMAMEIHREFYQAPQRYALGVDAEDFQSADGTVRTGWETIMGRVWAIGRNEDGQVPEVGQFTPASPQPYIEQVRTLAQLIAAEAAIPAHYLGFQTDNPASADAIRAGEARLVKRAERRQSSFGRSWLEVARLALLVRDRAVPDDFDQTISAKWGDPSTPTRSAAADEAVKLVGSGILPADSTVLWDRIGLDPDEQRTLASERRRTAGTTALATILERAAAPQTDVDASGTA